MRKCTSCGGFCRGRAGVSFTSEARWGWCGFKGQTSVFYNVDTALQDSKRQAAEQDLQEQEQEQEQAAMKDAAKEETTTAAESQSPR